jgi:hypothetical protein
MATLPDPRGDRQVKDVVAPIHLPLTSALLFDPGIE